CPPSAPAPPARAGELVVPRLPVGAAGSGVPPAGRDEADARDRRADGDTVGPPAAAPGAAVTVCSAPSSDRAAPSTSEPHPAASPATVVTAAAIISARRGRRRAPRSQPVIPPPPPVCRTDPVGGRSPNAVRVLRNRVRA